MSRTLLSGILRDIIAAHTCLDPKHHIVSSCTECATKAIIKRVSRVYEDSNETDVSAFGDPVRRIQWERFLVAEVVLETGQYTKPWLP